MDIDILTAAEEILGPADSGGTAQGVGNFLVPLP